MICKSLARALLIALPLAACGGGGSSSDPDAQAPDAALGFAVADHTDVASPLDDLVVTLTQPLDPASLDDDAVVLRIVGSNDLFTHEDRVVPAAVSYDDVTRMLTVTPRQALPPGATAWIELHDLLSEDADELTTSVEIPTRFNPYLGGESYDAGGDILFRSVATYDPDDPRTTYTITNYNGPGPDDEWATDDDEISSMSRSERFSPTEVRTTYATGSGANATWGDDDDVLTSWSTWHRARSQRPACRCRTPRGCTMASSG